MVAGGGRWIWMKSDGNKVVSDGNTLYVLFSIYSTDKVWQY
jgi:hypothetical protein